MKHEVEVHEGAVAEDQPVEVVHVERRRYRALVPLFKAGVQYEAGDELEMVVQAGAQFVEVGEAEELT